jgi:aromatic ring hydroxylase
MVGGRTAHSMFKIPVENLTDESLYSISKESQRADLLRQTRLIIWDEASPQHRHTFEALDKTCRDLRDDNRFFGGISVVFGGDFQQTLPIVKNGSRDNIINATIQHSYLWPHI